MFLHTLYHGHVHQLPITTTTTTTTASLLLATFHRWAGALASAPSGDRAATSLLLGAKVR